MIFPEYFFDTFVHQLTIVRQARSGQHFIVPVKIEGTLLDEGGNEVIEILGEHFRSMYWHLRWQIDSADEGDAIYVNRLSGHRSGAIAATFGGHIHHDGTGLHAGNHGSTDDQR